MLEPRAYSSTGELGEIICVVFMINLMMTDLTLLEMFWTGSVSPMMTQAGHSRVTPDSWGWAPYLK